MDNKLKKYFPMIRTREEILKEINGKYKLRSIYNEWNEDINLQEREQHGLHF